jgi:hypothetical protein
MAAAAAAAAPGLDGLPPNPLPLALPFLRLTLSAAAAAPGLDGLPPNPLPLALPFLRLTLSSAQPLFSLTLPLPLSLPCMQEFAKDQAAFFDAFSAAYVKMCGLGVTWR